MVYLRVGLHLLCGVRRFQTLPSPYLGLLLEGMMKPKRTFLEEEYLDDSKDVSLLWRKLMWLTYTVSPEKRVVVLILEEEVSQEEGDCNGK